MKQKNKICLISGITGQDGSFLAEFLLAKGYKVHGIIRRSSSFNTGRIDHIYGAITLHYGDVTDPLSLDQIVQKVMPDEVYHLAAQSHVKVSFDVPVYTGQVDALGTLHMLEAVRKHCPNAKFYNAATSELFGEVLETPQKETTPFNPRSPYGVAKIYAYHIVKNYRESYGMFAVNGILFNHESERRGSTFVTKKITEGLAQYIKNGTPFYLGNLDAKRDWGYAPDFVEGMWRMLQQEKPEDFVLATGETHTIKEFINECIKYLPDDSIGTLSSEIPGDFNMFMWDKDKKGREILKNRITNDLVIGIDEKYYRPAEVNLLLGDSSKAKEKLGWEAKTKFKDLIKKMMNYELRQ
jgi:GDPmannose 4,6-dehydratase